PPPPTPTPFPYTTLFRSDNPRDQKSANQAELALIEGAAGAPAPEAGPTPWKAMLASRTVWLLCLQYLCLAYAWIFYVTWLPKYRSEEHTSELQSQSNLVC